VLKRSMAVWARIFVVAGACIVAVPASASASTLWVSENAPKAPYNSCINPGYDHIQQALAGPGTVIHVCAGTYREQLSIERPVTITGYEGATVGVPSVTADSSTPCDQVSESGSTFPDQDEISICGAGKVVIKNLDVDAIWPGQPVGAEECGFNLYGILVAGGAELELSGSTVIGAAPKVINGCQYGVGIEVGFNARGSVSAGKAKLSKDVVKGYDKNGITIAGTGSEATIKTVTVTGAGKTPVIAQNGIGVQEGAKATITGATVSGNECEYPGACGPDAVTQVAADGAYFYEAAEGSSISKSTLTGNDVGVEAYDSSADPSIANDTLEDNRYAAVQIEQGSASVNSDTMRDGEVGIQLVQFAGLALGGTASHDKIEDMSAWAVLGLSDQSEGDLSASFSISNSKISGNPGAKPQQSVETENPAKLKIYAEKDS
jgi:nitrous oxidase accessory protein NosD